MSAFELRIRFLSTKIFSLKLSRIIGAKERLVFEVNCYNRFFESDLIFIFLVTLISVVESIARDSLWFWSEIILCWSSNHGQHSSAHANRVAQWYKFFPTRTYSLSLFLVFLPPFLSLSLSPRDTDSCALALGVCERTS